MAESAPKNNRYRNNRYINKDRKRRGGSQSHLFFIFTTVIILTVTDLLFVPFIGLFAVDAAVYAVFLVRQTEDVRQFLFDTGDAARVFTFDDVRYFVRKRNGSLLNDDIVLDDVNRYVRVPDRKGVDVDGQRTFDFDDVLASHFLAGRVLDDGNLAIQIAEIQILINLHGFACGDMVDYDSLVESSDIQHGISPFQ